MSTQEDQSNLDPTQRRITSVGFWLPVGRSNFFHAEHDQELLRRVNDLNDTLDFHISAVTIQDHGKEHRLNTSVYRRLLTVSQAHGFEFAIPYYPEFRLAYLEIVEDTDPELVLLVSKEFPFRDSTADRDSAENRNVLFCESVKRVALVVSDDGFYQWLFYHTPQEEYSRFVSFLKQHVFKMTGALVLYKSDPAKNDSDNTPRSNADSIEQEVLAHYSNGTGILVFFQLNLVLEGIHNSLFDPRLFFSTSQVSPDNNATSEQSTVYERNLRLETERYSLQGFIESIVAYTDICQKEAKNTELAGLFESMGGLSNSDHNLEIREDLKKLTQTKYHSDEMRRDFLRQFLRKTSSLTLKLLKWNLEDCRRELLPYIVSFTDYQQQLVQLPSVDERAKEFNGVNEAQLAGYVKLISAKFPLIENIRRYLELNFAQLRADIRNDIQAYYQDWTGYVDALVDNIAALERALDRVNDERRLHEQSQIRREQETQAEIVRRRQRLGLTADGEGAAGTRMPTLLEYFVLLTSTIAAIFGITYGMGQPWGLQRWAIFVLLPVLILSFLFMLLRYIGWRIDEQHQINNRFYHELDLTLELPINPDGAATLFEKGIAGSLDDLRRDSIYIPAELVNGPSGKIITQKEKDFGKAAEKWLDEHLSKFPRCGNLEKVAYRYSHGNFNEGTHKVHYEFDIRWPSKSNTNHLLAKAQTWLWKTPFSTDPSVMPNCELIYEVLSHSPSNKVKHMLREIRFIATYKQKLTPDQVIYLKLKLLNSFILTWLPTEYQSMESEIQESIYPLFSLTIAALTSLQEPAGNAQSTASA